LATGNGCALTALGGFEATRGPAATAVARGPLPAETASWSPESSGDGVVDPFRPAGMPASARAIAAAKGVWHFGQQAAEAASGRAVRNRTPHPSQVATTCPIGTTPALPLRIQTLLRGFLFNLTIFAPERKTSLSDLVKGPEHPHRRELAERRPPSLPH
jgi:hypothetical protein